LQLFKFFLVFLCVFYFVYLYSIFLQIPAVTSVLHLFTFLVIFSEHCIIWFLLMLKIVILLRLPSLEILYPIKLSLYMSFDIIPKLAYYILVYKSIPLYVFITILALLYLKESSKVLIFFPYSNFLECKILKLFSNLFHLWYFFLYYILRQKTFFQTLYNLFLF
jgi:hypothetical protein